MRHILDQFHSMRAALHLSPGGPVRERRLHAVLYDDPHACLAAVERFRQEGFEIYDVHTPFPVHGIQEAMGLRPTRLGFATLAGGLIGGMGAFALQTWVHVHSWPLVIGGKSYLAFPAQIPVIFEMTVLFGAFATVGGLLWRRRLYPRLVPDRPAGQPDPRVTDDRFVVVVLEGDASFDPDRFRGLVRETGAEDVRESWRSE